VAAYEDVKRQTIDRGLRREWGLGQLTIRNIHLLEANGSECFPYRL